MHPRRHLVVFVAISLMLIGIPYPALADSKPGLVDLLEGVFGLFPRGNIF